jgi:two-component system LytT family response regulator
MNLRIILVDDELPSRNRLRKFLMEEPDVEIIAECASGPEALECIRRQRPNLVFLDVQMPEMNGLEVARALPADPLPAIVFVTAHDRHAVAAFEVRALDYLLKPFSRVRLQEALRRTRRRIQNASPDRGLISTAVMPLADSSPPVRNRFAIRDGNQTLIVKIQDVDYIEAAANYVVLCTAQGNHVLRETLRCLEASLPPALFLRISRSVIVNVDRVKSIRMNIPGEWHVVLGNDRELLMTRGLKEVQERLQYDSIRPAPDEA